MASKNVGALLEALRIERGWTLYRATRDVPGLEPRQLQNLEEGKTKPWEIKARTMFGLVKLYQPQIKVSHFRPPRRRASTSKLKLGPA